MIWTPFAVDVFYISDIIIATSNITSPHECASLPLRPFPIPTSTVFKGIIIIRAPAPFTRSFASGIRRHLFTR